MERTALASAAFGRMIREIETASEPGTEVEPDAEPEESRAEA